MQPRRSAHQRNHDHHRYRLLTIPPHIPARRKSLMRDYSANARHRYLRLLGVQLILRSAILQRYSVKPLHLHRVVSSAQPRISRSQAHGRIVPGIDDRHKGYGCYQSAPGNVRRSTQAFAFNTSPRSLIAARRTSRFGYPFLSIPAPRSSPGFCPLPPIRRRARAANRTSSASRTDPE